MVTKELERLEEMIGFYRAAHEQLSQIPSVDMKMTALTFKYLLDQLEETVRVSKEKHKKLAWYMFTLTPEVLMAMDIHPFCTESLLLLLPTVRPDALSEFVKMGENAGLPPEICAVDRGSIGLVLSGQLPKPDFYIGATIPCDSIVIGYQLYKNYVDAPSFHLDAPYEDGINDLDYYTNEVRGMISFIEEQTGKRLDYDRLREVIQEANRATEYMLELNELRKAIPCPQSGRMLTLSNFLFKFAAGDPRGTEIYRQMRDDAKAKMEKGEGILEKERHRIVWFHVPVFYDLSIYDWLEQEFNSVIAMDMFNFLPIEPIDTSTPESMLRGLAVKSLNTPMVRQLRGPVEFYIDDLVRVVEDYKADSVIFAGHEGCKHAWASVGLIRDTCKELGVPLLVFDMDAFHGSETAASAAREKISEFLNTMAVK